VAWFAWQQRAKPSALPMFALGLAISVWTIYYIFEINSADLPTKLFWSSIKYPAVVTIPITLAVFLLRFAGCTIACILKQNLCASNSGVIGPLPFL
jgi:hypothetical protein